MVERGLNESRTANIAGLDFTAGGFSDRQTEAFFAALGMTLADEDRSNQLLDLEAQVAWLREIGFRQVDCFWKWRELALFGGVRL